jgi:hypothetical protein
MFKAVRIARRMHLAHLVPVSISIVSSSAQPMLHTILTRNRRAKLVSAASPSRPRI